MQTMRRFHFERTEDESGISGVGRVAEGVLFSSGWVALHWLTIHRCVTIYQSLAEMEAVHGHNGKTQIVWDDPDDAHDNGNGNGEVTKPLRKGLKRAKKKSS